MPRVSRGPVVAQRTKVIPDYYPGFPRSSPLRPWPCLSPGVFGRALTRNGDEEEKKNGKLITAHKQPPNLLVDWGLRETSAHPPDGLFQSVEEERLPQSAWPQ